MRSLVERILMTLACLCLLILLAGTSYAQTDDTADAGTTTEETADATSPDTTGDGTEGSEGVDGEGGARQEGEKESPQASGRLMLVDDEEAILETYGTILLDKGFNVTTFNNGRSALEAFCKHPDLYDIIVTDMTMPKMTGDKLSIEALKIRPDIPIIICTGYHENFTQEQAVQAGIKKYLNKPVLGPDLVAIIQELLPSS